MADAALGSVSDSIEAVGRTAGRIGSALEGMGRSAAVGLGMAAETLLQGGSLGDAAVQLGIHMASELTETFGEQAITRFTSSSLLAAITAPLAAVGSSIGGIIAAAIPVGMALLPVILIGAIVAAIAVLIFNEDIRNKVFGFIGGVLRWIGDALGKLGQVFADALTAVWTFISRDVPQLGGKIVGGIIDGLASLPGKLASAVWNAIRSVLPINIGPIHITEAGITLDPITLPKITSGQLAEHLGVTQHASGGWAGLHGPELSLLGENGPEYVIPNGGLQPMSGGGDVYLDGEKVGRILLPGMSRALFYELHDAAPGMGAV